MTGGRLSHKHDLEGHYMSPFPLSLSFFSSCFVLSALFCVQIAATFVMMSNKNLREKEVFIHCHWTVIILSCHVEIPRSKCFSLLLRERGREREKEGREYLIRFFLPPNIVTRLELVFSFFFGHSPLQHQNDLSVVPFFLFQQKKKSHFPTLTDPSFSATEAHKALHTMSKTQGQKERFFHSFLSFIIRDFVNSYFHIIHKFIPSHFSHSKDKVSPHDYFCCVVGVQEASSISALQQTHFSHFLLVLKWADGKKKKERKREAMLTIPHK